MNTANNHIQANKSSKNGKMSLKKAKRVLGTLAKGKSKEEIKKTRDYFYQWSTYILAIWKLKKIEDSELGE